jgi:NTE family protein
MNCTQNCTLNIPKAHDPVNLMLVGSGIRFPAFIGALRAVEELGLTPGKITGSSSGAALAALYATGATPDELLAETLRLDTRRFKDASLWSLLRNFGLCTGDRLEEWLDDRLGGKCFGDRLRCQLEIVATDMHRYRPVVFCAERFPKLSLATAAAASAAIPGVFGYRRLTYGNDRYALVDGSLMTGVVEGRLERSRRTLVFKAMSKRTLKRPENGRLTLGGYLHEMLTFSLHSQEKEFLKGGKWKDTILIYCAEISPSRFCLSEQEKIFLHDQGYEQTKKYLEYKWGHPPLREVA